MELSSSRLRLLAHRAFTLPEVVATLGLAAALVALGLGTGRRAVEYAQVGRARAELVVLLTAHEVEQARLVVGEAREGSSSRMSGHQPRSEMLDPWGNPYYLLPAGGGGTHLRMVSAGPDGDLATEFDNVHPD